MALIDDLKDIRESTVEELKSISSGSGAGSNPNTLGGGESVDHDQYERKLWDRLKQLDAQIAQLEGPAHEISYGV
jgi:hypothetical protein